MAVTMQGSSLAADARLLAAALEPAESARVVLPARATAEERAVARAWNLYGGLLGTLSERVQIDPGSAVAVVCVESSGRGYGPDGRLIIRFENHVFRRSLPAERLADFARHFGIGGAQPWLGHVFRAAPGDPWQPFHGSQALEWRVFEFAAALHVPAAHRAISMGLPQIMGFNHAMIGYPTPQAMLDRFAADVRFQLIAFFDFVGGARLDAPALRAVRRGDYETFATMYNGPGQAAHYGELIRRHAAAFRLLQRRTPGRSDSVAAESSVSPPAAAGEPAGPARRYEVRRGDTLGAIAGRFAVPLADLVRLNRIPDPDRILVGQVLEIPSAEPAPPRIVVPAVPDEEFDAGGQGPPSAHEPYVVQPGDTLTAIAMRCGSTVAALAALNGIENPDRIFAGQTLLLPRED